METELAKRMIDACHEAQTILNLMPPLPEGMTAQYMQMIEAVHDLTKDGKGARVSEIGRRMRLTLPGTARSLKALEKLGAVVKEKDESDGRAVLVHLSETGEQWYAVYIQRFYDRMTEVLDDVRDENVHVMIDTVHQIRVRMEENKEELL